MQGSIRSKQCMGTELQGTQIGQPMYCDVGVLAGNFTVTPLTVSMQSQRGSHPRQRGHPKWKFGPHSTWSSLMVTELLSFP